MISKTRSVPDWLDGFFKKIASKETKKEDPNKIPLKQAADMNFFKIAKNLGRDTFKVMESYGSFFDSGTI
jgi:hypothetical protein